jgi:glycosyl transferase family 25
MKAFIISLSKIESSKSSSEKALKKLIEYGLDAEIFEGTYGNVVDELFLKEGRKLVTTSFKGKPVNEGDEYYYKSNRPGVRGCFHSHYRLWQKCIDLNEPILIFEDDVILERGFIPVEWQEVLLVAPGKSKYSTDFYKKILYNPEGDPKAFSLPHKVMPGAVGYAIKPTAAKKLVERYKIEFAPADNALNTSVVILECHNYLMGRAAQVEDGKKSLTTSIKFWEKNKNNF